MTLIRNVFILMSLMFIVTACSQQQASENGQSIIPPDEQRAQNRTEPELNDVSSASQEEAVDTQDAKNERKPVELGEPDLNIKIADVVEYLNVDKMTFSDIKSYWGNLKGKTVRWDGTVDNIIMKDNIFRIRVALHRTDAGRPFFAILMGQKSEDDGLETIKKDDKITFMGKVSKFNPGSADKGSAIILRGARVVMH